MDGDGRAGLLLGGAGETSRAAGAGAAWLLTADQLSGSVGVGAADRVLHGPLEGEALGSAVLLLPDLDGDGRAELLIGAPGEQTAGAQAGAAWLFLSGDL